MVNKIIWTETALNLLKEIYEYYLSVVGYKRSQRLINKILDRTDILKTHPKIGQKENLLEDRKFEYRYLTEGNYKIIYWIDEESIKIATVFDSRRNPEKIKLV